jgi:hypothetical protein
MCLCAEVSGEHSTVILLRVRLVSSPFSILSAFLVCGPCPRTFILRSRFRINSVEVVRAGTSVSYAEVPRSDGLH